MRRVELEGLVEIVVGFRLGLLNVEEGELVLGHGAVAGRGHGRRLGRWGKDRSKDR